MNHEILGTYFQTKPCKQQTSRNKHFGFCSFFWRAKSMGQRESMGFLVIDFSWTMARHPEGLVPATAAYTQNAYGADPEAGPFLSD